MYREKTITHLKKKIIIKMLSKIIMLGCYYIIIKIINANIFIQAKFLFIYLKPNIFN